MSNRRFSLFFLGALVAQTGVQAQVTLNKIPSRVVGHAKRELVTYSANLPEARSLSSPRGIAVDRRGEAPILYVSDTNNHRVLAWRDATLAVNGAPADLIIGQPDEYSTLPRQTQTGLTFPSGLAVDSQGNLYVVDTGDNRILRYPKPFEQVETVSPNMVIGQTSFSGVNANPVALNEKTIALASGGNPVGYPGLTFDANGNLWFSDVGNNRVLRYPAAALAAGAPQPAADIVLGQPNFTSQGLAPLTPPNPPRELNKAYTARPSALTFDDAGRLYVCDGFGRALVYAPNATTGASAARIIGISINGTSAVNEFTLGVVTTQGTVAAQGIFFAAGTIYVSDTPANRILRYDPFVSWAPESSTQISPPAREKLGQPDYVSFRANGGRSEPSDSAFNGPTGAALAGDNVFVLDTGANRVLRFRVSGTGVTGIAESVLGQTDFQYDSPNLIEGRELFLTTNAILNTAGAVFLDGGGGIAVDRRSNPPHLYISDPLNHRVLGYRDVRVVRPGDKADIVIGQRDFQRALVNDPANDANQLTNMGLNIPEGVAVDAAGNVYVADTGNGRVLRFPSPFDQTERSVADLVLGQADFYFKNPDASSRTMSAPYGLAFTQEGHLLVSDFAFHRVLFFRKPTGGDFTSGMPAEKVFGQPDFITTTFGAGPNKLFVPHHIAVDTDDRLYVCDTGNNRVVMFDRAPSASPDPVATYTLPNIRSPHGIAVSSDSGEIWVTDTLNNRTYRYARYDLLVLLGQTNPDFNIPNGGYPMALALDSFGSLLVADSTNRIALYFPALRDVLNGANLLARPLVPGMITAIRPYDRTVFSDATVDVRDTPNPTPAPTTLNDVQVLVNDVPSPVMKVAPGQITFVAPKSTPTFGRAEIQVTRASTGQIIAVLSDYPLDKASPGFFTVSGDGTGQLVAFNKDGSPNSATNKASRGDTITVLGTGIGPVDGMPDDGQAPSGEIPAAGELRVAMGSSLLSASDVMFSGLAPDMIGVWKLVLKIPLSVPPGDLTDLVASYSGIPTNIDVFGTRIRTYIAVK